MGRKLQETISNEKGQALIWALIALTLGTILVTAFIMLLNTNVRISGKRHTKVWEIYSTDSGVEYAIYQIQNFSQTLGLDVIGGPPVTVTLRTMDGTPIPVNEETIAAMVRNTTPRLPIIFANSTTCTEAIDWGATGSTIIGDVHSNNDISISGAGKVMTGTMEYVSAITGTENVTFHPSPPVVSGVITWPVSYDINDYKPGGSKASQAQAEGKYHIITGTLHVSGNDSLDGLYYVTDDVQISGSSSPLTITIVAEGPIKSTATNVDYTAYTDDDLLFFSNKNATTPVCEDKVIEATGGAAVYHGKFYGPYGKVFMSGAGNEDLALYGNTVEFRGSGLGSTDPTAGSLLPEGCFYYDIISEVGGTETKARVLMCDNQPTVLSWMVD